MSGAASKSQMLPFAFPAVRGTLGAVVLDSCKASAFIEGHFLGDFTAPLDVLVSLENVIIDANSLCLNCLGNLAMSYIVITKFIEASGGRISKNWPASLRIVGYAVAKYSRLRHRFWAFHPVLT